MNSNVRSLNVFMETPKEEVLRNNEVHFVLVEIVVFDFDL